MPNTTALIYDPHFLDHDTGSSPECPARLKAILRVLKENVRLWDSLTHLSPRPATDEDLLRCHSQFLLDEIKQHCPQQEKSYYQLDPDTTISKGSDEIARLAAGAALTALDEMFAGKIRNAFALVRPPGHHATPKHAMGFCLYNNAAIAARYAQAKYGVKKVLIIDWDVHHGNGTQDIFYDDPSVFYFSLHEFPFYPGTGSAGEIGVDEGTGTTLNIPLSAGTSAEHYRKTFQHALQHIEKIFIPDLIIISAGFDSRYGDPLGELQLRDSDFAEMTQEVMSMADKHCGGKLISVLEGGYLNETLGEAAMRHVEALAFS